MQLVPKPIWLNEGVLVNELSGYGYKSHCSHLNFRYGANFEQGVVNKDFEQRVYLVEFIYRGGKPCFYQKYYNLKNLISY